MASIFLLSSLFASMLVAQDYAIGMDEEVSSESQLLIDAFDYYSAHPINLHESIDQLHCIPGISSTVIRACKQILKEYPNLDDIHTFVQLLPATTDSSVIHILLHCTKLTTHDTWSGSLRTRISLSYPDMKGVEQHAFLGSKESFIQRLFIGNGIIKTSLSFGKHAGERYEHGMVHGSLSYSKDNSMIIIGDHIIQIGTGILFSSGISMPNLANPAQRAEQWSTAIRPNTSLIEHPNFHGIAYHYHKNNVQTGMSMSSRYRYAYRNDEGELTGFPSITYARTTNELQHRDGIKEQRIACFAELQKEKHSISIASLYQYYQANIAPSAIAIGEQEQFLFAIDHRWSESDYTMSSTILCDKRGNIGGMLMMHHDALKQQQACIIRYYAPNLHSILGNSPGRFGTPNNEIGIQFMMNGKINSIHYASSIDVSSEIVIPSHKSYLNKSMRTIIQCSKSEEKKSLLCRIIHTIQSSTDQHGDYDSYWRCRIDYGFQFNNINAMYRIEGNVSKQQNVVTKGIGSSFELKTMKKEYQPWYLSFRFAWANTDAFSSALYLPETGLPGQLLIDPLYGIMTMVCFKVGYQYRNISCALLLRQRHKPLEETLGSGWMQIRGNMETECHIQTDITF